MADQARSVCQATGTARNEAGSVDVSEERNIAN
jgi:hypothetical protein